MNRFQLCALTVLLLFGLAVWAPATQIMVAGRATHRQAGIVTGLILLKMGWIGPLGLAFGWYANVPLLVCVARMTLGRSPGFHLPRAAACLAATALLPYAIYSEQDGWHRGHLGGPAVWLWLACFGLTFACALHIRRTQAAALPVSS